MATRFVRLDLSSEGRDFELVAVEPGIPLLDKSNAHYRVLHQWLGRLAAEPEWHGQAVDWYVCDDEGARLNDLYCVPVGADELRSNRDLARELDSLGKRLEQIQASRRDAKLCEALRRDFQRLMAETGPGSKECHFFKYRDAGGWRLVWAWGFHRKSAMPVVPAICTNPSCSLLFVPHEGNSTCPACEKSVGGGASRSSRGVMWLGLAVVAMLAAGIGYGLHAMLQTKVDQLTTLPEFRIAPDRWAGPVGGKVQYAVFQRTPKGEEEDVTAQVVAVAEDPRVLRVDNRNASALARAAGKSAVHFYLGDKVLHATVDVQPPKNPLKLALDPAEVTLGVGTSARLRMVGEFEGGLKVDLSEAAEWEPAASKTVFCYKGRLEGVVGGETIVAARYRGTTADPYLTAEAKVRVVEEEYKSLQLSLKPTPVGEGRVGRLEAVVVTASGEKRSVLEASPLSLKIEPPQLAKIDGEYVQALQRGTGSVKASFLALNATLPLNIVGDVPVWWVKPKELRLVVGEMAELQVLTSSGDPVTLRSSNTDVAEVLDAFRAAGLGYRVAGRHPGKAEITVIQEAKEEKLLVEVEPAGLESVAFERGRIAVPVDGFEQLRLMGDCGGGRRVELVPDGIQWERLPTASLAELDLRTLQIRGRLPTGEAPETVAARWGGKHATAQIDVVGPPLQLELTPLGPVQLPVGQLVKLRAFAKYGDGRRVELRPEQVVWRLDPGNLSGLELDRATAAVRASKTGVGPVSVRASCQGHESNGVEFRSVDSPAVPLEVRADRKLFLVDDTGRFNVSAAQNVGTNMAMEGVRYASSAPAVLTVNPGNGQYLAKTPGKATVTAKHPRAAAPAQREITVLSPDKVNLVLRPDKLKLAIHGRHPLGLYLVTDDGEEQVPLAGGVRGATLAIGRPDAADWRAPDLVGLSAAQPFEVVAAYRGKTARAVVEVLDKPNALRLVPETVSLAPGQRITPRVEQRLSGDGDPWVEVEPSQVHWNVPDTLMWTAARGDMRPELTPAPTAHGRLQVRAEYANLKADLAVNVVKPTPLPEGQLVVLRDPPCGEELCEGRNQRYNLVMQTGTEQTPANENEVEWTPPFENEFVKWAPPLLTAKKRDHEEPLYAKVGGRTVPFTTRTIGPSEPPAPPPRSTAPAEVHIVCNQAAPIVLPLRGRFRDFRVEAKYPDIAPVDVTAQATLKVKCDDPDQVPVAVENGRITGQRKGNAVVHAEFMGVTSPEGLPVQVQGQIDYDALEIVPGKVTLMAGEARALEVNGFVGEGAQRKKFEDIGSQPGLQFSSGDPKVADIKGDCVNAIAAGNTTVTVQTGKGAKASAGVVVEPIPGNSDPVSIVSSELALRPDHLQLKVGESCQLGFDLRATSGGADCSREVQVNSANPRIARFHQDNRTIEGISPGQTQLSVVSGLQRYALPVTVVPADPVTGKVVIEPAVGTISEGEGQDLHVILVTDKGDRIDRTNSALLTSSDSNIVSVRRSSITGINPGQATISAQLPGIEQPGTANFTVEAAKYTDLQVTPSSLRLNGGDEREIHIEAIGPGGRRELSDHPDLKVSVGGDKPDAVAVSRAEWVRGVSPGSASLSIAWRDLKADPVPVEVVLDRPSELVIEPREATVEAGKRAQFQVFVRRGGQEKPLSTDDGVALQVADPSVAKDTGQLAVRGVASGSTEVAAQYGSLRSAAKLNVIPADNPLPGWRGLRFMPDILKLQLGVPGASVRLVRFDASGQEEDVDHRASIEVKDPEIVDVQWTASGPVFLAKKAGQTQASGRHGDLETRQPLAILVVKGPSTEPTLVVRPDPHQLAQDQTGQFSRVQVDPNDGSPPIDVDWRVESADPKTVAVEGGKTLRGVAPGQTQVKVTPVNAGDAYKDLTTSVTVQVTPPPESPHLELTGPSRTSVGAGVDFHAELVSPDGRQDVSTQGASLVLNNDENGLAEVQSGCSLKAKQPGTAHLRARYRDLISNALPLEIAPTSTSFEKLELEIDRQPMRVGESRPYTLWGYPEGGGPRQDLTSQVNSPQEEGGSPMPKVDFRVTAPSQDAEIVTHGPPSLVATAPGQFALRAFYGPDLKSDKVDLEILPAGDDCMELRPAPRSITLKPGEAVPPLRMAGRPCKGGQSCNLDVKWNSEDAAIVAPDPQSPERFTGVAPGKTRMKGTYGDQSAYVDVTVAGDPIQNVTVREEPEWKSSDQFTVTVDVKGSVQDKDLQYRLVTADGRHSSDWKPGSTDGNAVKAELTSPKLRVGPDDKPYHLTVEAKQGNQTVGRYPLAFKLLTSSRVRQQTAPAK